MGIIAIMVQCFLQKKKRDRFSREKQKTLSNKQRFKDALQQTTTLQRVQQTTTLQRGDKQKTLSNKQKKTSNAIPKLHLFIVMLLFVLLIKQLQGTPFSSTNYYSCVMLLLSC